MFAKWFIKKKVVPQALLSPIEVTVYGTTWCGDTRRSRNLLTTFNVPYIWVDIDNDKQGEVYVREINRGNRIVPTIIFKDGTILVEPNDSVLTAALIAITSPATK